MSRTLLAIGVVSVLVGGLHLVGGGSAVAGPMLAADFDPVARWTMYVCWHYITVHLVAGGVALVWAARMPLDPARRMLARTISLSFAAFTLLFVGVALQSDLDSPLMQLGQWMLFLPLASAGLWATRARTFAVRGDAMG